MLCGNRYGKHIQYADLLRITPTPEVVIVNFTIITFSQIKVTLSHRLTQTTRNQKQC